MPKYWFCFDCGTWSGSGPIVPIRICICAASHDEAQAWYNSLLSTVGGPCFNFEIGDPFAGHLPPDGWPPVCPDGISCWKIHCADGTDYPFVGTAGQAAGFASAAGGAHTNGCVFEPQDWSYCHQHPSGSGSSISGGSSTTGSGTGLWLCDGKVQLINGMPVICQAFSSIPPNSGSTSDTCASGICIDDILPGEFLLNWPASLLSVAPGWESVYGDFPFLPAGEYGLVNNLDILEVVGGNPCSWWWYDLAPWKQHSESGDIDKIAGRLLGVQLAGINPYDPTLIDMAVGIWYSDPVPSTNPGTIYTGYGWLGSYHPVSVPADCLKIKKTFVFPPDTGLTGDVTEVYPGSLPIIYADSTGIPVTIEAL